MAVHLSVESVASLPALRLRPWRDGDLGELLAAHRDPEVRRWTTNPLDDEAAAARWLEAQQEGWEAGSRYSFAVVAEGGTGDRGRLVGGAGVKEVEPEKVSAEVGYWVAAAYRGQGVASRALEAVSQWALDVPDGLELDRLDLLHSVENEPSCAVAEKTGYALMSLLDPLPPQFPAPSGGHLHARASAFAVTG
ncbi:GNAT family N-acetyltransferase [Streptomyces iconiensis]|uniref:GNAT family N-acetyltransferase n=1 Tax=Streptomyces iconiensis TaxID=1384038 RepID=A0ABT7A0H6_9ACTN|nr:GNAT family N-acetyltransferase [Streptomyces iconiensis]MDJ1134806.1 GNAT family N-acetyltransferase [Streptomyces iconiensis]